MGKEKDDIQLLQEVLNDKEALQMLMDGTLNKDEFIDELRNRENEATPDNVVKKLLAKQLIKYRNGELYYFDKFWILDNKQRQIRRWITDIFVDLDITFSKRVMNDCVEKLSIVTDAFTKDTTRYRIYPFPNGTLYFNRGEWDFKVGHFDPDDDVREEENPVFPFEFAENDDVGEICKVFEEWGVDPQQLFEIITYSLFVFGNPYQICFFLAGTGANGKSIYLKMLEVLFPDLGITHLNPMGFNKPANGTYQLESSYLNLASEVKFIQFDMERLKNILGDESISVRKLYHEPYSIIPSCKFVFTSNSEIELKSTTHGDIRRFLRIPFEKVFPPNSRFFEERILPFIPMIFTFCLKESKRLFEESQLYINQEYLANTKEIILNDSSSVYDFMKEYDIQNSDTSMDMRHLYKIYKNYTQDNGQHPKKSNNFWKELTQLLSNKDISDPANKHKRFITGSDELKIKVKRGY